MKSECTVRSLRPESKKGVPCWLCRRKKTNHNPFSTCPALFPFFTYFYLVILVFFFHINRFGFMLIDLVSCNSVSSSLYQATSWLYLLCYRNLLILSAKNYSKCLFLHTELLCFKSLLKRKTFPTQRESWHRCHRISRLFEKRKGR